MYKCQECLLVSNCRELCDRVEIIINVEEFIKTSKCPDCGYQHFQLQDDLSEISYNKTIVFCIECGDISYHCSCNQGKTSAIVAMKKVTMRCGMCKHLFTIEEGIKKKFTIHRNLDNNSILKWKSFYADFKQIIKYLKFDSIKILE